MRGRVFDIGEVTEDLVDRCRKMIRDFDCGHRRISLEAPATTGLQFIEEISLMGCPKEQARPPGAGGCDRLGYEPSGVVNSYRVVSVGAPAFLAIRFITNLMRTLYLL